MLQQRSADVDFFMHRRLVDNLRRDRIALRMIPAVDNFFRRALQAEAINLPRRRQRADHHGNIVLAPLGVDDVGKHKRAPLFFRQAAKLPAHQRHQLGVFVDLLVDLDQQPGLIECRDMFPQVFEITHDRISLSEFLSVVIFDFG